MWPSLPSLYYAASTETPMEAEKSEGFVAFFVKGLVHEAGKLPVHGDEPVVSQVCR